MVAHGAGHLFDVAQGSRAALVHGEPRIRQAQRARAANDEGLLELGLQSCDAPAAGAMKVTQPLDKLGQNMKWIPGSPPALVRFIGVSEVLGAIGLVAPVALGILPVLTPVAAVCLVVVMVLAAGTHIRLGEYPVVGVNILLGAMAAFVAWGRF